MKKVVCIVWAIVVLVYPIHLALSLIPEIVDRVRTAELSHGVFSFMASVLWMAGNLSMGLWGVFGIAFASMTPFWFVVSKRVRVCWLIAVGSPLIWFLIYGFRFQYHFGIWYFGSNAFDYWCFLVLAAWPLIVLGYGYPELIRRGFLRLTRRRVSGDGASHDGGRSLGH